MVTVNLRSKEAKSSGNRQAETLIPDIDDIKQISGSSIELFKPILEADSLGNQINCLKSLFKVLSADDHQIASIVVVQWWFNSQLASSVRRAITGCLNQVKDENLRNLVIEQIGTRLRNDCSSGEEARGQEASVKNIQRCLENFSCGEAGVYREIEAVTEFLVGCLQEKVEGICEEDVSPVEKVLLTDQAVVIIRVLVAVTKDHLGTLSDDLTASLVELVDGVMQHPSLPLDLRSNAGIIYVAAKKETIRERLMTPKETDCEGVRLSLYHGVLSCSSTKDLALASEGTSLLQILLRGYLEVAGSVQISTMVLAYSRGLLNWSTRFLEACRAELVGGAEGLDSALEFTWLHLEHQVDSVKHNTKEFLSNIILSCHLLKTEGGQHLTTFLTQTLALPLHKKARFSGLSSLVRAGSLKTILEVNPGFRAEVLGLADEYALVGPISDLYDNILKADFKANKDAVDEWYRGSVQPLLNQLKSSESLGSSQLSRNLLNKCAKLYPGLVDLIFREEADLGGKLALYCLKLGRELGNPWDFNKHRVLIEKCMRSSDEEERLQALALLVESHSSVERFSQPELSLIREFVERNLALPGPAGRQVLLSNVKKLLTRMRDGAQTLVKKLTNKRLEAEFPDLQTTLVSYSRFTVSLVKLLFSNLFNGANFARRATVLEMLTLVNDILSLSQPPDWCEVAKVLSESAARCLYDCLFDNYDNNKQRALKIIKDLPPHLLGLTNPDSVRGMLEDTMQLMSSSKPSSCQTAGFIMKLLLTAPAAAWVFADHLGIVKADSSKVLFYAAVYVRNILADQLHLAETDLLDAAADKPMYGALHIIRSIYSELKDVDVDGAWIELTKDLVALGYSAWSVVAPVVASDSPEGHLPMDNDVESVKRLQRTVERSLGDKVDKSRFSRDWSMSCAVLDPVVVSDVFSDEIIEDIIHDIIDQTTGNERVVKKDVDLPVAEHEAEAAEEMEEGDDHDNLDLSEAGIAKTKEVSSQMLLLCAWRSVKELSLFLGDLCDRDSSKLLSSLQILEVSSFLMDLLAQTKHRGAFEQAYVAFTKLCECLWRSSRVELHSHPTKLLKELLETIAGNKKSSIIGLCATRRSAGVPFIVQAIVSTEPDPSSPVFKDTMERLIELASDPNVEGEYRVHAYNVLRALFRDTRLGESVAGFVESGMKVSINGFEASNWAERNSATLLFSALMTRIFGVKREKDSSELSAKNCLTGKVFFQRYPSTHAFLLHKLEDAASYSEAGTLKLHPALYPILLILSRIFPSPSESLNNPFKLSSLVPLVEKCSGSPILAIRQLAAGALVPLIPPDQLVDYGCQLLVRLTEKGLSTNLLHGLLLQLRQIKKVAPTVSVVTDALVDQLVTSCACPLISAQYISLLNLDKSLSQEHRDMVEAVLQEKLYSELEDSSTVEPALNTPRDLWKPLFYQECCVFLSDCSLRSSDSGSMRSFDSGLMRSSDSGSMLKLFIHPEIEVRTKALTIYRNHLGKGGEIQIEKADIFNLILCEKQDVCLSLLIEICLRFPGSSFLLSDLAFFISLLQVKQSEDVLCSALRLSGRILSALDSEAENVPWLQFGETIKRFSSTEQTFSLRFSVATTLQENSVLLTRIPKNKEDKIGFALLWSSTIDMIYDDEEEIRNICVLINKKLTDEALNLELAGRSLVAQCYRRLGRVWPAASILVVLGNIVTNLILEEDEGAIESDDRAFDKGEMNTYRELETTCRSFLPKLSNFLDQLSPKLLDRALNEQLPGELLFQLLPHLPAGVIVYSVSQLIEYFQVFDSWKPQDKLILRRIEQAVTPAPVPSA